MFGLVQPQVQVYGEALAGSRNQAGQVLRPYRALDMVSLPAAHPLRPGQSLSTEEVARLRDGIVRALEQGLANLGSSMGGSNGEEVSLRDHVNLNGEPGSNQEYLVAYGREGRPCRSCGAAIERLKLSNRSAHFCPRCQPAGGRARKRAKAK